MLQFFKRLRPRKSLPIPAEFTTPLSVKSRCILVGDIHGRMDLLTQLLAKDAFNASKNPDQHIVFVGDYVDRGENSAEVLRHLNALDASDNVTCLMGNHEKMMLEFLDDPAKKGRRWLRNGGLQTLASFGVGGVAEGSGPEALIKAAGALGAALGPSLERWLRTLKFSYQNGNMICVHAALDPKIPMVDQETSSLLWGHRDFFTHTRTDELWVAHGHTIVDQPTAEAGRISLDTGAYYSGRLSAAILNPVQDIQFIESK